VGEHNAAVSSMGEEQVVIVGSGSKSRTIGESRARAINVERVKNEEGQAKIVMRSARSPCLSAKQRLTVLNNTLLLRAFHIAPPSDLVSASRSILPILAESA